MDPGHDEPGLHPSWDEIEYFELAMPHAEKDEIVAGVKARLQRLPCPDGFSGRRHTSAASRGEQPRQRIGPLRPLPHHHRLRGRCAPQLQLDQRARPPQDRAQAGGGLTAPRHGGERIHQDRRFLRHLPQRDEPLRHLGQVHPPGVERRPLLRAGRPVPGLPHAQGQGPVGQDG